MCCPTCLQIELLCDFLSTVHLLRSLQPTALKTLAHAMTGQSHTAGNVIYKQGESARHLFVVVSGEVVMYENDALQEVFEPPALPAADHRLSNSPGGPPGSSSSSSGGRGSAQGQRLGSSSGLRTQSPKEKRAASPSAHRPGSTAGSPKRLGSSAGRAGSTAGGAVGSNPRTIDSTGVQYSEVRRVKPREAFGEDEVTAHTIREQTAVSTGANKHTFGPPAGSTSSRGPSAGGGNQSSGGAQPTGPARTSGDGVPAVAPAMLASGAAAAAAADPRSQCVLLVLSAEDYGAALEGRLTTLLEEKVREGDYTVDNMQQPRISCTCVPCDMLRESVQLATGKAGAALHVRHCLQQPRRCSKHTVLLDCAGKIVAYETQWLDAMQVTFLASLPAFKGLNQHYLRALSHCFHTVNFEPREVVVRQGDVSDCMYVLKSGQVCILIDPSMTLADSSAAADSSSGSGEDKKSEAQRSSGGGASEVVSAGDTIDTKKLVQVGLMSVSLVQFSCVNVLAAGN